MADTQLTPGSSLLTPPLSAVSQGLQKTVDDTPDDVMQTGGHPEVKASSSPGIEPVPQPHDVELPLEMEVTPEVAEHVEAVTEGEIELPEPLDTTAPPSPSPVSTSAPQRRFVVPITQTDFQQGATQPVSSAWRWLVEWIKWLIKKYPGRVLYRS